MTTDKLSDHASLLDDPADCCRAITHALLPLTDFARQELVGQFCNLVNTLASVEENEAEAWERSRHALALFAQKAEREAEAQIEAIGRVLSLARHGTGDHREMDRRIAAGLPAFSGPTVIEVETAQKVLAALGQDASEEAALRILGSMSDEEEAAS